MDKAHKILAWTGALAVLLSATIVTSVSTVNAQESAIAGGQTNTYNCTSVALDELDPSLLTKEERIALLDGSLRESIDSYSTCVNQVVSSMSGNGNGAYEGDEAADSGGAAGSGSSANPSQTQTSEQDPELLPPLNKPTPASRQVIAPKDNDKIICKLLFKEIKSTQDADTLKGLTEQYANYKCGT